ncbi:MAG: hypothetical protein JNL97_11260, partial [Verrucomicrobiales bacterium]|nr:hypothetical protein [Verrucomicrobiales bacterium]
MTPPPRMARRLRASTWLASLATTVAVLAAPDPESSSSRPASPAVVPRIGVYATAGDILHHLATPADRERTMSKLLRLDVSRVFLEGRRGDEYVAPGVLAEVRDFFRARNVETTGGIATVPGNAFGTRQVGPLGWLNWESPRTKSDVAGFFRENAPVFDTLIVDDFYCTGDESDASRSARGPRSWGEYRRDLLVGLIPELILGPSRAARSDVRLMLKFPQWYDRFHLFGYDPERMAAPFDAIWVGTEVRNPLTRRMGFVQPTEGYVNFRWLRSVVGPKVVGAWFDHIECTAQNFVDQAFMSVLAGADELTLFRLGDVVEEHPGDGALAARLPELRTLAALLRGKSPLGVPYYKPPGSDPGDNLYLMDYLAMAGWPILPVAKFPTDADAIFLGAQAAADPEVTTRLAAALERGATVTVTPAFLRAAGPRAADLAGVEVAPEGKAEAIDVVHRRRRSRGGRLPAPLDVDASARTTRAKELLAGTVHGRNLPILASRRVGRGRLQVVNVRTFSEQDFRDAGEWLLA